MQLALCRFGFSFRGKFRPEVESSRCKFRGATYGVLVADDCFLVAPLNENVLCPKKLRMTWTTNSNAPAIYGAARGFPERKLTRNTVGGSNARPNTMLPL